MRNGCQIALIGATGMVGEAVLEKLSERGFPVRSILALATEKSIGKIVDYGNQAISVQDASACDFETIDLVIFATNSEVTEYYYPRVHAAGCAVIDHSAFFLGDEDVPVVMSDINASALEGFNNRRAVCLPCTDTRLAAVLRVLHQASTVDRVHMTVCRPASGRGRAAVEALARQSAQLLNARPLELTGGMVQTAFNVFPVTKKAENDGDTRMIQDLNQLIGIPGRWLTSTLLQTPVFFGESVILQIETHRSIDFENMNDMLSSIPGINLIESPEMPTPVSHASGADVAYLSVLQDNEVNPHEIHLWLTSDKVRNVALNSVQIAEILIKSYI